LDVREGETETFQLTPTQALALEPRPGSPAIPESIARQTAGRINDVPIPVYELFRRAESPTPSIPEDAPPTYAQHQDDEVAYMHEYQSPEHAAEEITDVQGLPPYAPSMSPVPAPVLISERSGYCTCQNLAPSPEPDIYVNDSPKFKQP
jgi:hypothetical protein